MTAFLHAWLALITMVACTNVADARAMGCSPDDLAGLAAFPMPTDLDFAKAPWKVIVVAHVDSEGGLSNLKIESSSGSRPIDRSALKAAAKIQVAGSCLAAASGPLYLVFKLALPGKNPHHALARAWRSVTAEQLLH